MSVDKRRLRLVKSSRSVETPFRRLPDPVELEFIYALHSEKMADVSPTAYIRPIQGAIERLHFREVIGRFHLSYVDVALAMKEGRSHRCVMDTASLEMWDIYNALYDPDTGDLREHVAGIIGPVSLPNLLVINRIELLPLHRGMGMGLAFLWHLIRRHSAGCGIVAVISTPPQFRDKFRSRERDDYELRMDYESFGGAIDGPRKTLVSLYEKLGFREMGADDVMAMSAEVPHEIPEEIRRWVPDEIRTI